MDGAYILLCNVSFMFYQTKRLDLKINAEGSWYKPFCHFHHHHQKVVNFWLNAKITDSPVIFLGPPPLSMWVIFVTQT